MVTPKKPRTPPPLSLGAPNLRRIASLLRQLADELDAAPLAPEEPARAEKWDPERVKRLVVTEEQRAAMRAKMRRKGIRLKGDR